MKILYPTIHRSGHPNYLEQIVTKTLELREIETIKIIPVKYDYIDGKDTPTLFFIMARSFSSDEFGIKKEIKIKSFDNLPDAESYLKEISTKDLIIV